MRNRAIALVKEDIKELTPEDFATLTRDGANPTRFPPDAMLRLIVPKLVEELSDGIAIGRVSAEGAPLLYVNASQP